MEPTTTKSNATMTAGIIIVVIIVAIAALMMRGNGNQAQNEAVVTVTETPSDTDAVLPTSTGDMDESNQAQPTGEVAEDDSQVLTVEIEAGAFYYKPNVINAKKGQKIKIVMKSVDMMHDFVIDDLNVKMPVTKSGTTGTVEFMVEEAGTYEFYCSVGQHKAQGQIGTLIVK